MCIRDRCYTNHKDGFYVYAKPNKCNPETVAKYIGRYLGRPVIATSRIDNYDEDVYKRQPVTTKVLKEGNAWLLTSAMKDVVTKGTGTLISLGDMPVAGKTGTTSDYKDIWFSGYTPYSTCTISVSYTHLILGSS